MSKLINKINNILEEGLANNKEFTSDTQMLNLAIMAEYDAITFYQQLASKCKNNDVKKLFLDIAHEEKVHVGEFEGMLKLLDPKHMEATKEGESELDEI
jgi:rubrerythrin